MSRAAWNICEELAGGEVLIVLLRETRRIVGAGYCGFKGKPAPDVQRTELAHWLARQAIEICNPLRERNREPSGQECVQYAAPGDRRNSREFWQNSEFVQSTQSTKMKKSGTKSPTRQTQPNRIRNLCCRRQVI